jgi:hypothetical protein
VGKHLDKYQPGTQGEGKIIYTNMQKQKGCEKGRMVEATQYLVLRVAMARAVLNQSQV